MIGLGTIINVAAIVGGGLIGMVGGSLIKKNYQETLMAVCAVVVMFIGLAGALSKALVVTSAGIETQGTMMAIICFAVGSILGEWINLDGKMEAFGEWLKVRTGNAGDNSFVNAFVTASLTVCIGAMAVVGAIEDGISGNYTILAAKAILDLIIILVMTVSMGKGCMFSAIPVGIFQGFFTIFARFLQPVMTEAAMNNLSLTGNIMIFCVGVNLFWGKKIRVANTLPTLIFAVLWEFMPWA